MTDEQLLPPRCRGFLRMWRILVLLRCQPHTLQELSEKLSVCTRTIRRDLRALQAVPLPIESRFTEPTRAGIRSGEANVWSLGETPAWPRREVSPIADPPGLRLPPFPKGPLFPPGVLP